MYTYHSFQSVEILAVLLPCPTLPYEYPLGPSDSQPPSLPSSDESGDDEVIGSRPSRQCKRPAAAASLKLGSPNEEEDDDLGSEDNASDRSRHSKLELKGGSKAVPPADTRQKGPCSYEHCPNPNHSSGGGFKVVSDETKAGARDWSMYTGRVFCNACFTQYATRGTLQRPGRLLTSAVPAAVSTAVSPAPAATTTNHHNHHHHHHAVIADHDHGRQASHGGHRSNHKQLAPAPPARLPVFLDLEHGLKKGQACLEMALCCAGSGLEYQWLRDGKPIPGATRASLLLEHPAQVTGDFTCRVSNAWGATTPFVPITFPLSVSDAEERFATPYPEEVPSSTHYQLTCVCGVVRVGTPSELVDECACGLQVCGEVIPVNPV